MLLLPGGRLALPVPSWVSLVVGSGPGGSEVGTGVQAIHWGQPWHGSTPCPACPPLQSRVDVGAPGGPGRISVAAPGLGLAGRLPRGSRCGGGALVLGEHDVHPHPRNTPPDEQPGGSPERVLSWGTWDSDSRPRAWGLRHAPVLTGHLPQDVLAAVCIGLIGDGAD